MHLSGGLPAEAHDVPVSACLPALKGEKGEADGSTAVGSKSCGRAVREMTPALRAAPDEQERQLKQFKIHGTAPTPELGNMCFVLGISNKMEK